MNGLFSSILLTIIPLTILVTRRDSDGLQGKEGNSCRVLSNPIHLNFCATACKTARLEPRPATNASVGRRSEAPHRIGNTFSSPHGLHFEEGAPLRGGAEASVASRSGTAKRSMEMPPSCASFPENNGSDSFCIRMVDLPRQTRPSTGCFSADSGSCVLLSQACFARSKQHGQIPKAAPDRISFSEAFLPKCVTHAVRRKCNPCGEHMPSRGAMPLPQTPSLARREPRPTLDFTRRPFLISPCESGTPKIGFAPGFTLASKLRWTGRRKGVESNGKSQMP